MMFMQNMQERLEKIRVQIAECELIRDLATDLRKRELFGRLADHQRVLVGDIEKALQSAAPGIGDTFPGRKTQESFPRSDDQP